MTMFASSTLSDPPYTYRRLGKVETQGRLEGGTKIYCSGTYLTHIDIWSLRPINLLLMGGASSGGNMEELFYIFQKSTLLYFFLSSDSASYEVGR